MARPYQQLLLSTLYITETLRASGSPHAIRIWKWPHHCCRAGAIGKTTSRAIKFSISWYNNSWL